MVNYTENGVLSTAGDLVFGGGMDGDFVALNAHTGELLWHAYLGGPNASGPITYAVMASNMLSAPGKEPCMRSPYRINRRNFVGALGMAAFALKPNPGHSSRTPPEKRSKRRTVKLSSPT